MDEICDKKDVLRLIVNACGESTLALFHLIDKESADIKPNEAITVGTTLWRNLMEDLNRKNDLDSFLLALTNIEQLTDVALSVS